MIAKVMGARMSIVVKGRIVFQSTTTTTTRKTTTRKMSGEGHGAVTTAVAVALLVAVTLPVAVVMP